MYFPIWYTFFHSAIISIVDCSNSKNIKKFPNMTMTFDGGRQKSHHKDVMTWKRLVH